MKGRKGGREGENKDGEIIDWYLHLHEKTLEKNIKLTEAFGGGGGRTGYVL